MVSVILSRELFMWLVPSWALHNRHDDCTATVTLPPRSFGAIAFGIGTSEVEMVMASQCLLQSKPKLMRINVDGVLNKGGIKRHCIIHLIEDHFKRCYRLCCWVCRVSNSFAEYGKQGWRSVYGEYWNGWPLRVDSTGWNNLQLYKRKRVCPAGEMWMKTGGLEKLFSDDDAVFDKEYHFDAADIQPMITYGTNPEMGIGIDELIPTTETINENDRSGLSKSLAYMGLQQGSPIKGQKVDYVFIGSCTNSRIEDLRMVASFIKGKRKRMMWKYGSYRAASR